MLKVRVQSWSFKFLQSSTCIIYSIYEQLEPKVLRKFYLYNLQHLLTISKLCWQLLEPTFWPSSFKVHGCMTQQEHLLLRPSWPKHTHPFICVRGVDGFPSGRWKYAGSERSVIAPDHLTDFVELNWYWFRQSLNIT